MYRIKTWIVGKTEEKRFLALEIWCYKRILKIGRTEYVMNENVFGRVGKIKSFLKVL